MKMIIEVDADKILHECVGYCEDMQHEDKIEAFAEADFLAENLLSSLKDALALADETCMLAHRVNNISQYFHVNDNWEAIEEEEWELAALREKDYELYAASEGTA